MVFRGEVDAERTAYIKFLRGDGGLTVRQICENCGVSRATVYRCLKGRETIEVNIKKLQSNNNFIIVSQKKKLHIY